MRGGSSRKRGGERVVEDYSETRIKAEVDSNDSLRVTKQVSHVHLESGKSKPKTCERIPKANFCKPKPRKHTKVVEDVSEVKITTMVDSDGSLTETVSRTHLQLRDSTTEDATSVSFEPRWKSTPTSPIRKLEERLHEELTKGRGRSKISRQFQ